jgi:hypothetical protein
MKKVAGTKPRIIERRDMDLPVPLADHALGRCQH